MWKEGMRRPSRFRRIRAPRLYGFRLKTLDIAGGICCLKKFKEIVIIGPKVILKTTANRFGDAVF